MAGSNDHIADAVARLLAGGLVAVPTETVYGLAADATNAAAVAEIYRTKGRPSFNPLIVHVTDVAAARKIAQFNPLAERLAGQYWPGPLTLILPKTADCPVAAAVTAGLDTIAVRCPAHPIMQQVLVQSQLFLAAPSANASGGISPTTADHVRRSLGAKAPMIIDGGASSTGIESTIIAVIGDRLQILRPGPITSEDLAATCAAHFAEPSDEPDPTAGVIRAPGQLASHYAPAKPLRLNVLTPMVDEFYIGFGEIVGDVNLSPQADLAIAASNLFAQLHQADASEKSRIAVAPIPNHGIGAAINDRLSRAASEKSD